MAWVDIPDTMGVADYPLHSGMMTALQANLDRAYEESIIDLASFGTYEHTITATDEWEAHSTWVPMPIPLRTARDGSWRALKFEAHLSSASKASVRLYLLDTQRTPYVDPDQGILFAPCTEGSADAGVPVYRTFDAVTPEQLEVLRGDGSVGAVAQPVVWLHICVAGTAAAAVLVSSIRIIEVLP